MINTENIKTFVQQTLGCGCPEEVFRSIDCQSNIKLTDKIFGSKVYIGNKLLIYIMEVHNTDSLKDILPFLIDRGKKERDSLGLNRFRLVLATDTVNEIKEVAEDIFKVLNKDEKIHLHIVSKKDIALL